ncbi:MAG: MYG1 family protein, partial [bacterium]
KEEVKSIVENSKIIDDNILVLERFVPWQEYVVENCKYDNIKFVIYQNKDGKFNAQAVPVALNSRETRCLFPAEWAGLEGDSLKEITKVNGSIFCHRGRFLVVAENLDSVLKLVKLALQS